MITGTCLFRSFRSGQVFLCTGRLAQTPRQVACAVHHTHQIQVGFVVRIENKMPVKGPRYQTRPQPLKFWMLKMPRPSSIGALHQLFHLPVRRHQVAAGDLFTSLYRVPAKLSLQVREEKLRFADSESRQLIFPAHARCAISTRSCRAYGVNDPRTAFNSSASSSGLAGSRSNSTAPLTGHNAPASPASRHKRGQHRRGRIRGFVRSGGRQGHCQRRLKKKGRFQNCRRRREESLIAQVPEPRYLGSYRVLKEAQNYGFHERRPAELLPRGLRSLITPLADRPCG